MKCRLSIIVPTFGRPSLGRTLRSIRDQPLDPGDEVLLVADGPLPAAEELFRRLGLPGQCVATEVTRDYGGTQRNRGLDLAGGDYLLFMDDDDAFAPGAFATIRAALAAAPGRPHLFRMRYAANGRTLWAEREVAWGNVSTQMIVFPNDPRLGRWDSRHGHDYRFIANNLTLWPPGALVWREEVIAVIRPAEVKAGRVRLGPLPVEQCPLRAQVWTQGGEETACCGLLREIAGVDERLCRVGRDACETCCASFPPSPAEINPVVASLLWALTEDVQRRGGVLGCTAVRAATLQRWAERGLDMDVGEPATARCPGGAPLPLSRLVPPPAAQLGPAVRRWAVGVTTSPRRRPTLGPCLDSLRRAGWDRPRLFVDSAIALDERFADLPVTLRDPGVGAWPNYYLALAELLMRHPEAEAYFLLQDDVILYDRQDLRRYLEECLWPADPVGAVSLFCSSAYTRPEPGWHAPADPWVWGAQAFIFPRESAKRLVSDRKVLEHRWDGPNQGRANIDVLIGRWASRHGLPVYCPTPSLAQHVGHTSTLWPDALIEGGRWADRFAGDVE